MKRHQHFGRVKGTYGANPQMTRAQLTALDKEMPCFCFVGK